jgi:two-component sensor histidine kinase
LSEQFYYQEALAICYNHLRKFELAEIHLAKADSMETKAEAIRGQLYKAGIYSEYGYIFLGKGQFQRARSYFEKYFLTPSPAIHHLANDLMVCRSLIQIDSILHDPTAGVSHYKKYSQLLDSNFRVSKIRQAEELQVMYQTQEKESQIASLNQQAKFEQANLKQARLVKNLTMAGIVAVLIIAGLLYRQNRLRKKTNNVITHKNEQLQHLLTDKEWLLKEIHHRVKNNLQVVMSLLNSQSAYINNDAALTAIHDSQHRVHAMSLIHQKLYNSDNVSSIDISSYIRELVSYLSDSFDIRRRIRFDLNIEPLEMDVSQAVPLGLILNEAITNSIKYAFPDNRNGVISISFFKADSVNYKLSISDNGIGMPDDFKRRDSLGISLMKGLSEDLDGNFSIENNNGAVIKISFVHDPDMKNRNTLAESFISNN